ncbi:MAG: copper amine oxidase N-terminal domain-containing protein, partial [Cohnella sp.]|nr:copper amine oxidase N-terminal domain-containing protein [Cohnella sp.]
AEAFVDGRPFKLDAKWVIDTDPVSEYEESRGYKSMRAIRFNRTYKGIRTNAGAFTVYVSKISGEVVSYSIGWRKTLFAEPKPKLDVAAAARIFLEQVKPILTNGGGDGMPGVLAYEMARSYRIDAMTGKLIESFNLEEPTWYKVVGKPRVPKALATKLLMSLYDIELQYVDPNADVNATKETLAYFLKLKPATPRFYTGQGPSVNANNGEWMDFIGQPLAGPVPEASDWLIAAAASADRITYPAAIAVDGNFAALTVEPRLRKGIALASSREFLGALKATFQWNAKSKQITAVKDGSKLVLTVGSNRAIRNGKTILLPTPPELANGRTYIPAAAVAQAFGGDAVWNASSRMLLLRTAKKGISPSEAELGRLRWAAQLQGELSQIR